MSVEVLVALRDDRLPSCAQVNAALASIGADMTLADVDDLREHAGYIPAVLGGRSSGFEWYYEPANDGYADLIDGSIGDRAHIACLVFHSDEREAACACYAAAALCRAADGLFFDEAAGEWGPAAPLIADAKALEADARR
jgi:hypothetical protein